MWSFDSYEGNNKDEPNLATFGYMRERELRTQIKVRAISRSFVSMTSMTYTVRRSMWV